MAANWTADEMQDLSGSTIVVTGANTGLGYEATRAFARKGGHVVMACRSIGRGREAAESIREELPAASLSVHECDLADLDSVRAFAEEFEATYPSLHVLCNNAGVMAIPRSETAQGFETQFGVNHLGHFALTGLLLDRLIETGGETRVVTQSSGVHESGEVDFEDLNSAERYDPWDAYAQSKLANLLFTYELDRRLHAADLDVTSVACHPGYAATDLQRRGPEMRGSRLRLWAMGAMNALLAQSAEAGALPMLYAATHPDVEGGEYVGPDGFRNMRGAPEVQDSSDRSYDRDDAERLWDLSEELSGVEYGFERSPAGRAERLASGVADRLSDRATGSFV